MHKSHNVIIAIIFILTFSICFFSKISILNITDSLLTVVSIIFGFTITSLVSLIGQDFVKRLKTIEDKKTTSNQSQLQTLSIYFLNALKLELIEIILLIVFLLIKDLVEYFFVVQIIISSLIIGILATCLIVSYLLVKVLIRVLRES